MIEKMTLEQFREIKRQLASIIKQGDDLYEQHKNDENYNYDADEKKLEEQYLEIQNRLLSYDLSDIPYAEWMNMEIISDESHIVDFSKTKANIDFSMLDYSPYANYKSCKIQNIGGTKRILDSEHFDSDVIRNNPSLFLSESFPISIKQKFYDMKLNMEDLFSLSNEQIQELRSKQFMSCFDYSTRNLINKIGFQKAMQLYATSKDDYKVVHEISSLLSSSIDYIISDPFTRNDFEEELKNADVTQIKNVFYSYMRKALFKNHKRYDNIKLERLPEQFVKENNDILLIGENIPDDLRQRYYTGRLTLDDIMNNISLFRNIPISQVTDERDIGELADALGEENLPRYIEAYPEIFNYIIKSHLTYEFCNFVSASERLNLNQTDDVKQKITNYLAPFLTTHNKLGTGRTEQLMAYDTSLFPLDEMQQRVVDTLNLDNIKRFEKETQFFSIKNNTDLQMFQAFASYFRMHSPSELAKIGIDFKNGTLSYEEFLDQLAKCLDHMKQHNVFTDFPDYDFIEGEFRDKHPEIFVDINAPEELKDAFYRNKITPEFLFQHRDYIPYLTDKNLLNTLRANIKLSVPSLVDEQGRIMPMDIDFINEYVSRYGNEKLLQLVSKYGAALSDITISSLHDEIENEKTIEKSLRNSIYNKIIKGKMNYSYLASVSDFVSEYPEIFVNFDNLTNISQEERQRLTKAFYGRTLSFDDIKKYPELADYLKDKNLSIAFGNKDGNHYQGRIFLSSGYGRTSEKKYSDLELLEVFGNEKFLQLCTKYGRYMDGIVQHLNKDMTIRNGKYIDLSQSGIDFENGLGVEEISKRIEDIIVRESKLGNLSYRPDDAPSFLRERQPELFLSDDAPEELKQFFYNYSNNYPMSFEVLQKHKDWLPFLKDKALTTSLLRNSYLKKELIQYLELFGEEKGIKLGINRAETVKEMMRSHQIELMKSWYDKTGGKFIPDFVVMQNFSLEEADKFLASGSNWGNLMRIQSFARIPEARDAMLKLAYSFGAFDQDQRGFKKLQDLLTGLPKKIDADKGYILDRIDEHIEMYTEKDFFFTEDRTDKQYSFEEMLNYVKNNSKATMFLGSDILISDFLETLQKEKVDIDFSKSIFKQLYRKNDDGTYSLTINQQTCPKTAQIVRTILGNYRELPILTPDKAHQLFGGFELKYDADFREFLLANMDKIMDNPEYVSLVASVQKQFSDIKAINSNRALTWELAVSYVQTNKFTSVNVGNERVAEISAIAGYSQSDFNTLQQIYNYGKQRTFSSIPRIEQSAEKTSGRYTYETLRLDDPLAMAIGTLTDCCQELNNCAEVCMEHSMVDKNGRVFVIKDEQGNIVAQSWVWRNKDVLCFDNIEIPDKAFARAVKEHPDLGRKGFTDEVFEIYKQAAHDLIVADEKVYKELLESGKITQEQYDGLRLGKITVGLGYNDIAESLKQNSAVDKGTISRPLPFEEPVKLSRGLYTSDSTTQYILEERDDRKEFDGDTLPVHSDAFVEYSDSNFTEKSLLSLEKLEIVTKEDPRNLDTSVSDYADSEHLVTEIARNYGLNPETARIIMNPNFAIIYDVNGDKLRVGDLLFNTRVDNEQQQMDIENQVVMQMRLALEQIASDKEIDVSSLDEKQKEMYAKITGLTDEMDIERGVGHAR